MTIYESPNTQETFLSGDYFSPLDFQVATMQTNQTAVMNAIDTQRKVYVNEGYIDDESNYTDGYTDHSTYFLGCNESLSVTARLIPGKDFGITNLPTFSEFALDTSKITNELDIDNLWELKDSDVVEVSALASLNGSTDLSLAQRKQTTLALYARMLRHSVEEGHELWVMATDQRVTRALRSLIGDSLIDFGEPKHYMGSTTEPVFTTPKRIINHILNHSKSDVAVNTLKESLSGMRLAKNDPELESILSSHNISTDTSILHEIKKNPRASATAGLVGYAALRALPLGVIDEFTGDPLIFGAIDIASVPPYVKGLDWLYSSGSELKRRVGGLAMSTSSFLAPYLYLYSHGNDLPAVVHAAVGVMAGTGVVKAAVDYKKTEKRRADFENIETI